MATLRFVTANDLVSLAIRGGEMGFWASHVEALMPDGTLIGAHVDGGVQARPRGYDAGQCTRELFVALPCAVEQDAAFEAFLRAQIGKPYDLTAIGEMAIGVVTGEAPDWPNSPAWICSALQTAALLKAGIIKGAPATVRLATPRDVLVACAALAAIGAPQPPEASP
jgi:hypothetical protein